MRWILRISLRLKRSSWCGGLAASNGGSWWRPMVLVGGEEGVTF